MSLANLRRELDLLNGLLAEPGEQLFRDGEIWRSESAVCGLVFGGARGLFSGGWLLHLVIEPVKGVLRPKIEIETRKGFPQAASAVMIGAGPHSYRLALIGSSHTSQNRLIPPPGPAAFPLWSLSARPTSRPWVLKRANQ